MALDKSGNLLKGLVGLVFATFSMRLSGRNAELNPDNRKHGYFTEPGQISVFIMSFQENLWFAFRFSSQIRDPPMAAYQGLWRFWF